MLHHGELDRHLKKSFLQDSFQRCLPFWFALFFCFCSTYLCARPPTVYKHFMFFLKFTEEKLTMRILKDIYFHQMNNKNTLRNEDYCATCRTLGLISVVVVFFFFYLCWQCYFIDLSKPVLFLKAKNISFVEKKEKRRHNCSLSCTHKKWIMSQEGKGSRVPTPRH